jgi:hypothetical protein
MVRFSKWRTPLSSNIKDAPFSCVNIPDTIFIYSV